MKAMILVWGSAERGKSQSIKRLAMTLPFSSIIRPWNADDYDSRGKGDGGQAPVPSLKISILHNYSLIAA